MKYIDAEKLKAEIKHLKKSVVLNSKHYNDTPPELRIELDAYYAQELILDTMAKLITSLQQERPEGGCSEKPNDLLSERAEPRKTRKQERPEAFSCSHENDNEPPHAGIEGVVLHVQNVHYIFANKAAKCPAKTISRGRRSRNIHSKKIKSS